MDFSNSSIFPAAARPDCSPTGDAFPYPDHFDEIYGAHTYPTSPDQSLENLFNYDLYFNQPVSSAEVHQFSGFPLVFLDSTLAASTTPVSLKTPSSPAFNNSDLLGQLEQFPSGSLFEPIHDPFDTSVSSVSQHSQTPSLCGDRTQQLQTPSSPELCSDLNLKHESTDEGVEEPMPKRPKRKGGRARLDRSNLDNPPASLKRHRTSGPRHNQVERKYREGLNAELERLRRSVPTLQQSGDGGVMGQLKPSKAMILAGAIDYIKKIELERDMYREETDRLRSLAQQGWLTAATTRSSQ